MNWFGYTINTMSLGGLAIAIGELVDDAIIDVENVIRRLRETAQTRRGTVARTGSHLPASTEIRGSVVFATVIVVSCSFLCSRSAVLKAACSRRWVLPTSSALTASLAVALTVTPALCSCSCRKQNRSLRT